MEAEFAALNYLAFVVALTFLLCLFYGPWQSLVVDWARDRIFAERDAVFDLAAEGRLAFSDPVYRRIREGFNLAIRRAHLLTVPRLIVFAALLRPHKGEKSDLHAAIEQVEDKALRATLFEHYVRVMQAVFIMIFLRSLSALILTIPTLLVAVVGSLLFGLTRVIKKGFAQLFCGEPWLAAPRAAVISALMITGLTPMVRNVHQLGRCLSEGVILIAQSSDESHLTTGSPSS
ncbi:MAG: hypothetical protein A2516_10075 [Alphaproteobacteria bacterium RIFOXYD12_FULL_60_8]|nr:MAG: hypothetical protein A2516_10075 [Alphaproteobacteria bacterium RIFOXYD12_FULL_60_8]